MFRPPELGTFLIKAPLGNPPRLYSEPYMVPLMLSSDILAVLGVSLGVPAIVLMSLDSFDIGMFLTSHVLSDIFLERTRVQRFISP